MCEYSIQHWTSQPKISIEAKGFLNFATLEIVDRFQTLVQYGPLSYIDLS